MPGRVLVVDDEESIRVLIQRLLKKHGFMVETASDGGVALDMLSKDGYDALVLDLMMPRVDGFTVLRQLIATNPDLVSKTIVATAYPKDVARRQLNEVCRVIIKPFDTSELVEAVRECMESPSRVEHPPSGEDRPVR
jgi:DNA-binding response OmpR family regulator